MQKFETLRQPLLGNKSKKSGKIPKIVASYVYDSSQGQRMHSAQTKILLTNQSEALFFQKLLFDSVQLQLKIILHC